MSHMVIYRGSDGKPGYHQTDDIHDAVGFVEQMRNDEGVEHARIFRLEEVVFQYRPYYRVELAESGFGELGVTDAPSDNTATHGSGEGTTNGSGSGSGHGSSHDTVNGSATAELSINAKGGAEITNGGNAPSDTPAAVATGSSSGSGPTASIDDNGASKRGLFGR